MIWIVVTATGLKPRTTYFVKEHSTIWPSWTCIYKNIEEYNPNKKHQVLIVFDDMIFDMLSNKKLNPIVTELFIRGRRLKVSLVFISQDFFCSKNY